ncbi:MAG TPA: hypothetical protein VFP84_08710 [Kofleriaceae bacterium]|nr:hypothetical protein [Kofleriaceae bacterium]
MVRRALLPLSTAVLAALGGAAGSGLLAADAAAQVAARRDDDDDAPPPLLVVPSNAAPPVLLAGHSSHRSHSSHASHRSHYSSSGGGGWSDGEATPQAYVAPPPPPKPAHVSLVALPGGQLFLDGKLIGRDASPVLTLKPGSYAIRVVNRFLGEHAVEIDVSEGQTGTIPIHW